VLLTTPGHAFQAVAALAAAARKAGRLTIARAAAETVCHVVID